MNQCNTVRHQIKLNQEMKTAPFHLNCSCQEENDEKTQGGLRRLLKDERGLSSVEYVILLVMIVVGAVATWKSIGSNIKEGLGKAETDSQLIIEGTGH